MKPPRSWSFTVHGTPKPKGSARGFIAMKKGGKPRAIVTSDNKNLKSWETAVRFCAQRGADEGVFFLGPVRLAVQFFLQRPASVSIKKRPHMTTAPDLSKLVRGIEDALNEVIWKDDALVVAILATKSYAPLGESSRAVITVTAIDALREASPERLLTEIGDRDA